MSKVRTQNYVWKSGNVEISAFPLIVPLWLRNVEISAFPLFPSFSCLKICLYQIFFVPLRKIAQFTTTII